MTHKELTKIREEKKLTKGQFAALIGISAMMQGRYESGKIAIPDHIAQKVLALGAAKAVKEMTSDKAEKIAKDAAKAAAKKVVKDTEKKIVKDAEKKIVKKTVKAAAGVAAAHGVKKASDAKKESDASKKADKEKASKGRKKKEPVLYIESLLGGTITAEEVLKRIPDGAEEVYVKPEENKAYWVKGKKTGAVDLW